MRQCVLNGKILFFDSFLKNIAACEKHKEAYATARFATPTGPAMAAARIYVSVKRIFLNRGSYARTSAAETGYYHQKNVVAYPQNPDAALTAVGMAIILAIGKAAAKLSA